MIAIRTARGFTLIEMITALVIISIAAVMASAMLTNAFQTYLVGAEADDDAGQARLALERMTRELRGVRSATAADLITLTANDVKFVYAPTGATIEYTQSGTTLTRTETPSGGPAGSPVVLADNVNALTFTYFDNTGRATTSVPTSVYYIEAQIKVNSQNLTQTFSDLVKPTAF